MKITFFSNTLNHLQTPFCEEMYQQFGNNFTFVSTMQLTDEMRNNGYLDCSAYPYNLNSYVDDKHHEEALKLGLNSDIVIFGSAPQVFIKERLRLNKHTFRYSERLLKKSNLMLFDPRILISLLKTHTICRYKNVYMLCASAFISHELDLIFAYPNKRYKWGYFTEVKTVNIEKLIGQRSTERIEIVWTARFIDWKHPELAVKLAYELKKRGYNFHLNMIGTGKLFSFIERLIKRLDISDNVTLLGSIPNVEVRIYMENANIFIFTSDRNEGWGAVLNEAMSSGCGVVASNAIGAVPYLIEHEQNGLIFTSKSLPSLMAQTERLINDKLLREKISRNAYYTLAEEWNAKNACSKFNLLVNSLLSGNKINVKSGPCSPA